MFTNDGEARRERREWLLRVCSQSLQRQQVGASGTCIQAVQGPGVWRPAPGWVGQNTPDSSGPARDEDQLGGRAG